jgi:hypothetical protein
VPPLAPLLYLFGTTATEKEKKTATTAIARKSETLYRNLQNMIERRGLNFVGFSTGTFKENLTDRVEAQRRFHSLHTGFFGRVEGLEFITAVERQERGAIHYHLAAAFPWDIRTGFDFQSYAKAQAANHARNRVEERRWKAVYSKSATPALRAWWNDLRKAAKEYGFGRWETIPVKSNAEGIARYVGGYVGKEFALRESRDRGLRTLRYSLDFRPWAARWSYKDGGQATWRKGCSVLGAMMGTDDLSAVLGKRWAYYWRDQISVFSRHYLQCLWVINEKISDNSDASERIVKASRLAEVLLDYERENGRPCEFVRSKEVKS